MPIEDKLLKLTWTLAAWDDYEYWQGQDKKTLKRINALGACQASCRLIHAARG